MKNEDFLDDLLAEIGEDGGTSAPEGDSEAGQNEFEESSSTRE